MHAVSEDQMGHESAHFPPEAGGRRLINCCDICAENLNHPTRKMRDEGWGII